MSNFQKKQIKKVFVGGLDKDTDLQLQKNGDYHHGLNIRNISSESTTEGVIENIKGNTKSPYNFPELPAVGKRRLTLFMPWFNYFFNYGGTNPNLGEDISTENFDGQIRDENDPHTYEIYVGATEEFFDPVTGLTTEYTAGFGDTEEVTVFPFPHYFAAPGSNIAETFGNPSITLLTFDIAIGFSLAEMSSPSNLFQISYNGEDAPRMSNYLTHFVNQHSANFSALGITVSVIDNNSPYFDEEYYFGESTLNNITSHPDYTPGQIYAYALLFEGAYSSDANGNEEGLFYIDLKTSSSAQPLNIGSPDNVTGTLFTVNSDGLSPYFFNPEEYGVSDGYPWDLTTDTSYVFGDNLDWSGSLSSDIWLTEDVGGFETVGWIMGGIFPYMSESYDTDAVYHGDVLDPLVLKSFMMGNATIVNDTTSSGFDIDGNAVEEISYDTIGAYEDTRNDKIYWMVASSHHFHLILEYDIKTNSVETVFRDSGNNATSVFNWRKEFLINDIDRVGDVLYWTSRQYGEPCSINVRKSKISIALVDSLNEPYVLDEEGGTSGISLEDYYPYNLYNPDYPSESKREYVEVIKRPPMYAPVYVYSSDTTISKNNLFGNLFQFRYRYHFYDNEVSAWSPISDIIPSSFDNMNISQTNITPQVDNFLIISVKNSSGIVKKIEIVGRKCKDLGAISRGNRGPYSIVATLDNDFSAWQLNSESEQQISFYNDQAYPNVQAGEGERLFDAVPRSAQTQTILGNNRLTYGNYTEGFDVPKVNLSVTPQYGYVNGDDKPYGGPNYTNPVTFDVGESVSSFKSGAFHSFGIVYYDEKGRCSTVLTDDTSKCYVKFPTERVSGDIPTGIGNPDLTGAVTMKWSISHSAPSWAKHYRWFYSRNNTVDQFVQFRVLQAKGNNDGASNDNRIFLNLRGLKGSDDSYITNAELDPNAVPNPDISILDYEFTKGDRVRIITSGTQTTAGFPVTENILTTYYDAKVSGFEFYAQNNTDIPIRNNNGTNALLADGSEDGWYLIIDELIDSTGTPIAGYSSASVLANSDSLEQSIIEIYKPKPDAEPGELLYFEYSELYGISNIGGRHLGPLSDQGAPFTFDAFGNSTSATPATGEFLFGDVYYKRRNMQMINSGAKQEQEFYVEDYFLNDFTDSNHISVGRANIYSAFFRQQDKEASLTYSDVYQPATSFNGLSTFNYNLFNWEDYSRIYGSIQKIHYRETDIVMIQEDATYKIPVQRDILLSADGKGMVGVSNKILNPVVPFAGNYGISKNAESFVANGSVLYWTDIRRGAILRLSGDGITPISDVKMHDYFRDKEEVYRIYDPQFQWSGDYGNISSAMLSNQHKDFRIKGGFNPKHEEYIVQMDPIPTPKREWDTITETYDNAGADPYEVEVISEESENLVEGSVIAWREKQKRWVSEYSHMAEYYCKINRLFVSWDSGFLYLHDQDEDNYNTFYGVTYDVELDFSINESPSTVKGFKSIVLEANQAVESDSAGVEETEKTSYDITLVTDMTQTSINRNNFDQRENKQYTMIPFVTTNSTGSEIIGIGSGTVEAVDDNGDSALQTVTGFQTTFGSSSLILGTSSDVSSNSYGDQLFYNDGTSDVLVGTISDLNSDTELTLAADAVPFVPVGSKFLFVKRSGFAEGDRMKGRYMEIKMKKKSKKLLEIFSSTATVFNSELSDD